MKNRTWAEVRLDHIEHNFRVFQQHTKNAAVMCIIKANAYGHGAVTLGLHLQACGCGFFGVASLDEAIELAGAGVGAAILVLGHTQPERTAEAAKFPNIRLTVFGSADAARISQLAAENGEKIKLHIKIDTGMTRLGLNIDAALPAIEEIHAEAMKDNSGIEIEGMFTHFASADELDPGYTELQFGRFMSVADALKAKGIHVPMLHACNSAATIMFPHMHLNMVRMGISLYGCYPSDEVDKGRIALLPAMSLKTQITRINCVPAGMPVGYGRTFTTARNSVIATIPIGYADGLSRLMAGKLKVMVRGAEAPIVGRICMDQSMLDVTDIPGAGVLDEVVVYGGYKNGGKEDGWQPVERVADVMGTNNYEILCMTQRRVPRIYTIGGEPVSVKNYLK